MSTILIALIAAVISQCIGFLWHGPLFGMIWARAQDMAAMPEDGKMTSSMKRHFMWQIVINFTANFVMAFVLFYFLSGIAVIPFGWLLILVGVVFIGFILPVQTIGTIWNGRSLKKQLITWSISTGFQIINLFVWVVLFAWLG
jgi:hypothetical protein